MKKCIRALSVILILGILMATPVYANAGGSQRASAFFSLYNVYLLSKGGYKYDVYFDVTATGTMQDIGATSVEIQRSPDNGTTWEHVCTYSSTIIPSMMGKNTGSHAWSASRIATEGYRYRAIVIFYAKDSSGSGTNTVRSINELQY